jgi:PDZ domain-containing secreted protein
MGTSNTAINDWVAEHHQAERPSLSKLTRIFRILSVIKAGDIITAIDNEPLKDVYEYMKQLAKFSKGDEANITIQRKTETLTFKVKF